ncbi:hypothetical protein ABFS82_10G036700 [Erythranthe guttata]
MKITQILFCAILLQAILVLVIGNKEIITTAEEKAMIIGRLPRGVPIPPSGPSRDEPYIPPVHRVRPISTNQRKMIIGRLPRGVPIPPSGPAPYDPNHPAAKRRAR